MKYRVEVDISFDKEEDAITVMNCVEKIKAASVEPQSKDELSIVQYCKYHKCYHDEDPPKPCEKTVEVDFKGKEIAHETGELDAG